MFYRPTKEQEQRIKEINKIFRDECKKAYENKELFNNSESYIKIYGIQIDKNIIKQYSNLNSYILRI